MEPEAGEAFVDLAHADHPTDPGRGPAAVHIGSEGNETPVKEMKQGYLSVLCPTRDRAECAIGI